MSDKANPRAVAQDFGWKEFQKFYRGPNVERRVGSVAAAIDAAIDAFLATVLEGADERVAELARNLSCRSAALALDTTNDPAYLKDSAQRANADCSELGKLVLALSAKLKEVEEAAAESLPSEIREIDDDIIFVRAHNSDDLAKTWVNKATTLMRQIHKLGACVGLERIKVHRLQSELTAQKAAHVKMLRDEADRSDKRAFEIEHDKSADIELAVHYRRQSNTLRALAAQIEGGA